MNAEDQSAKDQAHEEHRNETIGSVVVLVVASWLIESKRLPHPRSGGYAVQLTTSLFLGAFLGLAGSIREGSRTGGCWS